MVIEHAGIAVSQLEQSIDFYANVFGFTLLRQTPANAYLYLGDGLLELIQSDSLAPGEPASAEQWKQSMISEVGLNHLGFRVEDMDQAVAEIERRGGRIVVSPYEFVPRSDFVADVSDPRLAAAAQPLNGHAFRLAIVADPDGTMLELVER
jgi:catechol 2,3-dioxygenase-like lactoylglutathione lyase family enzyme